MARPVRHGVAPAREQYTARPIRTLLRGACTSGYLLAMSPGTAPPKTLLRVAGRAIFDHAMIRAGDRVLLGLSGGKDSLSLLHVLRHFQAHAPIDFELGAATVDPMVEGFDPSALRPYLQALSLPFHYRAEPIMERALEHMGNQSFCAFCARMKRGILYDIARREGYSVLALGQHLDDAAESFLMSAFHGGRLKTMKAHYRNDAGDLRVIRPLIYARERQTAAYAHAAALPVIQDNCPACFRFPQERARMKELLAGQESEHPLLFKSLKSAILPLICENSAK